MRISAGTAITQGVSAVVDRAAGELLTHGTCTAWCDGHDYADIDALFLEYHPGFQAARACL
jgi:hypothetical protein